MAGRGDLEECRYQYGAWPMQCKIQISIYPVCLLTRILQLTKSNADGQSGGGGGGGGGRGCWEALMSRDLLAIITGRTAGQPPEQPSIVLVVPG